MDPCVWADGSISGGGCSHEGVDMSQLDGRQEYSFIAFDSLHGWNAIMAAAVVGTSPTNLVGSSIPQRLSGDAPHRRQRVGSASRSGARQIGVKRFKQRVAGSPVCLTTHWSLGQ